MSVVGLSFCTLCSAIWYGSVHLNGENGQP